jgi:hypothetical protein
MYNVGLLVDANLYYVARLLMKPFNLLHWFIYDSTSHHYNLSLQWVLTFWCLVSERYLDLFCPECWQLTDWLTVLNWLLVNLLTDCFVTGFWLSRSIPFKQISRTGYRTPSLTVVYSVAIISLLKKRLTVRSRGSMGSVCWHRVAMDLYLSRVFEKENRCVGAPKSVPGRWIAAFISEVSSDLSQYYSLQWGPQIS